MQRDERDRHRPERGVVPEERVTSFGRQVKDGLRRAPQPSAATAAANPGPLLNSVKISRVGQASKMVMASSSTTHRCRDVAAGGKPAMSRS